MTTPLGTAIATARQERGYTQARLSRAIHVSEQSLSAIEQGRSVPKRHTLNLIEQGLGLEAGTLLILLPAPTPLYTDAEIARLARAYIAADRRKQLSYTTENQRLCQRAKEALDLACGG